MSDLRIIGGGEMSSKKRTIVSIIKRERIPGTPIDYDQKSVDVIKEMVREGINYLGGTKKFVHSGDKVLIKPNVFWTKGPETALNTDPRVVEAIIRLIREEVPRVKKISIWENCAMNHQVRGVTTFDCYKAAHIDDVANRTGVELLDGETGPSVRMGIPGARTLLYADISKSLMEADCYISVPKLKTHSQTLMTGAIKNQQGCLKSYDKVQFHGKDLAAKLTDLYRILRPKLTIMDAIWVLEGQGPLSFFPEDLVKDMNVILVGQDCVALDAVATAVMCYEPLEVPTTRIGGYEGLGVADLRNIEVKGVSIDRVKRPFKRPSSEIEGVYPNIHVYMHGGCEGCTHAVRFGLDKLATEGFISKIDKPINLILGFNTRVPTNLNQKMTLVIGDCAKEHKNRARVFFPGCPHIMAATSLSEVIKSLLRGEKLPDFSYLPYSFQPIYQDT